MLTVKPVVREDFGNSWYLKHSCGNRSVQLVPQPGLEVLFQRQMSFRHEHLKYILRSPQRRFTWFGRKRQPCFGALKAEVTLRCVWSSRKQLEQHCDCVSLVPLTPIVPVHSLSSLLFKLSLPHNELLCFQDVENLARNQQKSRKFWSWFTHRCHTFKQFNGIYGCPDKIYLQIFHCSFRKKQ